MFKGAEKNALFTTCNACFLLHVNEFYSIVSAGFCSFFRQKRCIRQSGTFMSRFLGKYDFSALSHSGAQDKHLSYEAHLLRKKVLSVSLLLLLQHVRSMCRSFQFLSANISLGHTEPCVGSLSVQSWTNMPYKGSMNSWSNWREQKGRIPLSALVLPALSTQ